MPEPPTEVRPEPIQPRRRENIRPAIPAAPEPVTPAPAEPVNEPAPAQVETVQGASGITGETEDSDTPQTQDAQADPGFSGAARYDGLVLAALERAKRYPAMSRQRGVEGVVGVVFEIDRLGRVLDARLTHSSGSRRLDRAALEQITRASPFPPAPQEAPWQTRRFATEIRFSLR
nr:TonB family protein [Maricaulis parjimensis]